MAPAPILIVGVDIGVLTSGISCSLLHSGVTNPLLPSPQLPTSIKLQGGGNHLEPTELGIGMNSKTYGTGIAPGEGKLTLLKLSMTDLEECPWRHEHLEPHAHDMIRQELGKIGTRYGFKPQAMAEYIKRLWADGRQNVVAYLRTFDNHRPGDVTARFVFGVPAIWDHQTIVKMREAIERSGILAFGRHQPAALDFVREPVAAAMAVLRNVAREEGLDVGDKIVILDCGGGTVDTAVYKLSSSPNDPASLVNPVNPVNIEQCMSPKGTFLGAIFMKRDFASFVKQQAERHMGNDYSSVDQAVLDLKIETLWTVMERSSSEFWNIDHAHRLHIQRTDNTDAPPLRLESRDIREAVQRVANDIARFARKQVRDAGQVARIIVVGGFGRNSLVKDALTKQFGDDKVVFTAGAAGEHAVKDGACWEGIRLSQADVNASPPGQDLAGDGPLPIPAETQTKKAAPASYGFCPDAASTEINWFISEGDLISRSSKNPSRFPFPPAAAFTPETAASSSLAMTIYKTTFKMKGPVTYKVGDQKVAPFRVVKCKNRELLEGDLLWEIAVHIYGTSMHFRVSIGGQPSPDDYFTVGKAGGPDA
ncbi:hypothetical protein B0I37DRAFT_353569 [Chaetomium sp. MPI-CAGE-AT-0009]|nr:hypothetical protein B0I37DRAFT_353569 [Chaetomium sp. MPI-CAGE-AT-0009]